LTQKNKNYLDPTTAFNIKVMELRSYARESLVYFQSPWRSLLLSSNPVLELSHIWRKKYKHMEIKFIA